MKNHPTFNRSRVKINIKGTLLGFSMVACLVGIEAEAAQQTYTQYSSNYQHEAFEWTKNPSIPSEEIELIEKGRPRLTKNQLTYKNVDSVTNQLVQSTSTTLQSGKNTQYETGLSVDKEELQVYHDQVVLGLEHWENAPQEATILDTQARTVENKENPIPDTLHITSDITYLDQVAVKEQSTKALTQLRREMYEMNVPFNGKKLQEVAKEYGYHDAESYATAWSWDNDLEALAIQRAMETAYETGMANHSRPGGMETFTIAKIDNGHAHFSENLAENYTSMRDIIYYGGWGYDELPELIKTNGHISRPDASINGHLHASLNPEYDTYATALIYGPKGILGAGMAGYKQYLNPRETGGSGLVGWYEIPYLTADSSKPKYVKAVDREDPALVVRMAPGEIITEITPGKGVHEVDRIFESDRYKNAVEISKKGWNKSDHVFIANGDKFADALTGSPLASIHNAPLLLVREDSLDGVVKAELNRLQAKTVTLLGGIRSLTPNLARAVEQLGIEVRRIGGKDRYEQAALVAREILKLRKDELVEEMYIADGKGFSDSLNIATLAAEKKTPILLVNNQLSDYVTSFVEDSRSFTIVGGPHSINQSLQQDLSKLTSVERIQGENRYTVNRNILKQSPSVKHYFVVSGDHYSDALPASLLAEKLNSGILFVRSGSPSNIEEQLAFAMKQGVEEFTLIGGLRTLSLSTQKMIQNPVKYFPELF